MLGLRSSEVLGRKVRDLDDSGRALAIPGGKTKNARRWLTIESEPLRALLQRQIAGKRPEDLLFGSGKPLTNDYLWDRLQRYCGLAGVPRSARTACAACTHDRHGARRNLRRSRRRPRPR